MMIAEFESRILALIDNMVDHASDDELFAGGYLRGHLTLAVACLLYTSDAASDSVRPLTVCGCDESRQMATWLKGQKVDIERVLVSPYLRAEQTLDIVGELSLIHI